MSKAEIVRLRAQGTAPPGGMTFADLDLIWYANQGEEPLFSPASQLQDHIALNNFTAV